MSCKLIVSVAVIAALALSACSSDDGDDRSGEAAPNDGNTLPDGAGEGGDSDTSMPAPDFENEPFVVDGEPSGDDTSAIAGLWSVNEGPEERRDERFVEISDDGLYTDYDDRSDALAAAEGEQRNCYAVTPRRLDLESGDGGSGSTYGASGIGTFELIGEFIATAEATDGTWFDVLGLEIARIDEDTGEPGEPIYWYAASSDVVIENLQECDG